MKTDSISMALGALSLAGAAIVYSFLPETVPIHWNASGEIDSWGPRWNMLILGALPLAAALLFRLLPLIDPKRESYARHAKAYAVIQRLTVLCLAALVWVSVAAGPALEAVIVASTLGGIAYAYLYSYLCWRRVSAVRKESST